MMINMNVFRRDLLFSFFLFVVVVGMGGTTGAQNPNLKYFGLWTYNTTSYTSYSTWTNLFFSDCEFSFLSDRSSLGLTSLCNIESFLFISSLAGPLELVPNYEEVWSSLANQSSPYLASGLLSGFFLGDELIWTGLNYNSLVTLTNLIRQTFPTAIIYYNEAYPVIVSNVNSYGGTANYTQVPVNLDWVSVDIYPDEYPSVAVVQEIFSKNLYPLMQPTQWAIYVPPAYCAYSNDSYDPYRDVTMVQWAQDSITWAQSDPMLIGLLPWHWDDLPNSQGFDQFAEGLASMTAAQAVWQPFGASLRSASTH